MKLGILTATRTDNNGTDLQAYAMQKIFSKYCDDVKLINYVSPKIDSSRNMLMHPFTLKKAFCLPFRLYKNINHNLFRNKFFVRTQKTREISKLTFDKYVVGSDQIWNLKLTDGDINFFLPECNKPKYSYAASFGSDSLIIWDKKYNIFSYLKNFDSISIRENININELQENGLIAREDLDPIMMLNTTDWKEISKINKHKNKYVLVYLAQENEIAFRLAKQYEKKYNLKVIYYTDGVKRKKGICTKRGIGIRSWIDYVLNAEIIITNSYHCLSFSILFNKKIALVNLNNSVGNISRLVNLLNKFNIINDTTMSKDYYELFNIEWDKVNNKINELRNKSFAYIKNICDKEDDFYGKKIN